MDSDVANVHELMFKFWDSVPREPGCRCVEIYVGEEVGEVLLYERAVIEKILLGVEEISGRDSGFIIIPQDAGVIDVLFPRNELFESWSEVEVGVVECVISDSPIGAWVVAGVP